MNKNIYLSWSLAFLLALFAVYFHQGPVVADREASYQHTAIESKVKTLILEKYYRKVEAETLHRGALKGMFSELDPYSSYIPPRKVQEFTQDTTGKFGGLGIIIEIRDEVLTVVTPIEGSPAHKAGVQAGDKILKVKFKKDGKWIEREADFENVEEARNALIGQVGTKIILTVLHKASRQREEITIVRDTITIRSVKGVKILDAPHKIGYVRLTAFQMDTEKELVKALHAFEKKGVKSLVLDLRFNPGGLLKQAIKIADHFLNKGVIVQTKNLRNDKENQVAYAKSGGEALFLEQVVILINRGSASASEIVAGALQDHNQAILIGERSWGKGSVQTILDIPEKRNDKGEVVHSKIKLTTALYYTPKGRSIHRIIKKEKEAGEKEKGGLEPDVLIETTPEEEVTLMRLRQREDIQSEKKRAEGDLLHWAEDKDRQKIRQKFYRHLRHLDNLHLMEWKRSQTERELFIDRALEKAKEVLSKPDRYRAILKGKKP